ncbi:MAG: exo-alpha-sialidase [Bauldia sp.]
MKRRVLTLLVSLLSGAVAAEAQDAIPVAAFPGQTHVHGLAIDPTDPSFLFIATHHGLYRSGPDGQAELVSVVQDFMGFSPSPDARTIFASGHPATGGNLGLIVSNDNGRTWVQRSPGLNGPADFHMLAVSRADPKVIYGVYGGLQRSSDAGLTWTASGQVPTQTVDIAASAIDPNRIYAAAVGGLFVSADAGASWTPLVEGAPVSVVELGPNGELYAFALGQGLLVAANENAPLEAIPTDLGPLYLIHLALDPTNIQRIFAADQAGEILVTDNRGQTWRRFGT